jgi:hypothetical protein
MAKRSGPIPDALAMRRLLYDPATPQAEKDRVAADLRAQGRRTQAIRLYEGRPEHPSLKEDLRWAVDSGASFTVFALRAMGVPVTPDDVRACAVAAESKERWYDAHRCYRELADEEALKRVAEKIPGYQLAVPANKA